MKLTSPKQRKQLNNSSTKNFQKFIPIFLICVS